LSAGGVRIKLGRQELKHETELLLTNLGFIVTLSRVRLSSNRRRPTRDLIYAARRKLSRLNTGHLSNNAVYINEHLTKYNDKVLFLACRQLRKDRKIHSAWTWHGISYAKRSETSRVTNNGVGTNFGVG